MGLRVDQYEAANIIADETGQDDATSALAAVRKLTVIARQLSRFNLDACSVKGAEEANRPEMDRLQAEATTLLSAFPGIGVEFNEDPRGASIHMLMPKTRRYNSLSGGWTIPE